MRLKLSAYLIAMSVLMLVGCNQEKTDSPVKPAASVAKPESEVAGWKLVSRVDAMTDKSEKEAFITSDEGHRLTILRRGDNTVWMYLKLSGMNQFGIQDKLILRVDKNDPVDFGDSLDKISAKLSMPIKTWEWNPDLIGFRAWHGESRDGCGYIKQLINGSRLVIRYHPNESTYKDIFFNIGNNPKAISEALNLDASTC